MRVYALLCVIMHIYLTSLSEITRHKRRDSRPLIRINALNAHFSYEALYYVAVCLAFSANFFELVTEL
jgi:hypothetical protein